MGKEQKAKAAAEQAAQQEWANKPWWQKYWKAITAVALAVTGIPAFIHVNNVLEKRREVAVEKEKYGGLWEYKDQIPPLMIKKNLDGQYSFKDFLLKLKRENGKFLVHTYIGEPPISEGIQLKLASIPADLVEKVKMGLEKWNYRFKFIYVDNPQDADLTVYAEYNVMVQIGSEARAIGPDNWRHQGWKMHAQDAKLTGDISILVNGTSFNSYRLNSEFLPNFIGHEFGHHVGLNHPEVEFYFRFIAKTQNNLYGRPMNSAADAEKVSAELAKINTTYPEFSKLSIMTGWSRSNDPKQEVGEFDQAAFEIIFKLLQQEYGPDYQPPEKPSQHEQTTKWREQHATPAAQPFKSSTGIPGR